MGRFLKVGPCSGSMASKYWNWESSKCCPCWSTGDCCSCGAHLRTHAVTLSRCAAPTKLTTCLCFPQILIIRKNMSMQSSSYCCFAQEHECLQSSSTVLLKIAYAHFPFVSRECLHISEHYDDLTIPEMFRSCEN